MNPDEQVWNEIKNHRIGKQPVENKNDLKKRLYSALRSVQKNTGRILSFFQLPATQSDLPVANTINALKVKQKL